MYRGLETANMLHGGTVRLHCLHVLVEDCKYLIVEDLVLPDAVRHLLQGHVFDDLVLAVLPLDFQQVVTKVEEVKAALLSEQHDDGAACPVQPVPEALLCCELVGAHRNAVDKLHGTPQTMELHTLIDMHHTVGGRRPAPHPVLQEAADTSQDDLEHGKAAAQPLFGQQVPLPSNGNLLWGSQPLD